LSAHAARCSCAATAPYACLRFACDGRVTVRTDYDLAGNRTHLWARYADADTYADKVIHRYYAYDMMNRQILVDGESDPGLGGATSLAGIYEEIAYSGALGTAGKGHIIHYDRNGNRISDTFLGRGVRQEPEEYLVGYEPGQYGGPIYGMRPRHIGFEATVTDSYHPVHALTAAAEEGVRGGGDDRHDHCGDCGGLDCRAL
jgi:hypothetical protein